MMKNALKKYVPYIARPILSKIHRFKDAHRGEHCYLFGDGISIKWFDLTKFTDKIAMPCAQLPFHKQFSYLHVKYLLLMEPYWFYPICRTTRPPIRIIRNHIQKAYRDVIKNNPDKEFFINLSNYPVLSGKNITYIFKKLYDARLPANFLSKRINSFEGSINGSILLAIYLGFDHVYLVGFDYTHSPARSHHWYEKGHGVISELADYQKEFFDGAKEFIDITTITLDGKSDHLDYVTYQDYTGCAPAFKENNEIVEEKYLKILSTWPGNSIF
ncbi:MAG: hypothetical protein A2W23_03255 [Planctomycetes bacterium RBG_16_43_13]|nr:MAG: hypothetical protein A2W23_03255 [Planctomycetes bacterium RBG_16_43_13]